MQTARFGNPNPVGWMSKVIPNLLQEISPIIPADNMRPQIKELSQLFAILCQVKAAYHGNFEVPKANLSPFGIRTGPSTKVRKAQIDGGTPYQTGEIPEFIFTAYHPWRKRHRNLFVAATRFQPPA